jgi:hypothetical protein
MSSDWSAFCLICPSDSRYCSPHCGAQPISCSRKREEG